MGKTSAASKNKYNQKAYDRIALVVPKGMKELYRQRAEKQGLSLNAYINKLLEEDIKTNPFT